MLILASNSPRRKEILTSLSIPFRIIPSEEEEYSADELLADQLPVMNAKLKSESVAALFPNQLVLGADTIVELGDEIIEKPVDRSDALKMLMMLAGKKHQVITAVCLTQVCRKFSTVFTEKSSVEFNDFDQATAEDYIKKVHVLDKAGAYAVQEYGEIIIRKIEGSVSNVIGLPIEKMVKVLKNIDFEY